MARCRAKGGILDSLAESADGSLQLMVRRVKDHLQQSMLAQRGVSVSRLVRARITTSSALERAPSRQMLASPTSLIHPFSGSTLSSLEWLS